MIAGKASLSNTKFSTIILAAGIGKRMYSRKTKVLHKILGKTIVSFVTDTALKAGSDELILVVGKNASEVKKVFGRRIIYARQPIPLGTGDAAQKGIKKAQNKTVLILNGDIPLLKSQTIQDLIVFHRKKRADLTFLTCHMQDPYGYGRVIRDKRKNIVGIVEHSDATPRQQKIHEMNVGVYYGDTIMFMHALKGIYPKNVQTELYLPDVIHELLKRKKRILGMKITDEQQIQGINSKVQLAAVRRFVKEQWFNELMRRGVAIEDPATTNIDLTVKIGKFVRIRPYTMIEGNAKIKDGSTIGPFTWIRNGKQRTYIKNV